MYISVDVESSTPLYAQIKEQIRLAAGTSVLQPGDQLPPVRELATHLRVNFNTVARVYRELQAEGLLDSQRGSGTFISKQAPTLGKHAGQQIVGRLLHQAASLAANLELEAQQFNLLVEEARLDVLENLVKAGMNEDE